jgi:hypothetical protein
VDQARRGGSAPLTPSGPVLRQGPSPTGRPARQLLLNARDQRKQRGPRAGCAPLWMSVWAVRTSTCRATAPLRAA